MVVRGMTLYLSTMNIRHACQRVMEAGPAYSVSKRRLSNRKAATRKIVGRQAGQFYCGRMGTTDRR